MLSCRDYYSSHLQEATCVSRLCLSGFAFRILPVSIKELACACSPSVKASLTNEPGLIRVVLTKTEAPSSPAE